MASATTATGARAEPGTTRTVAHDVIEVLRRWGVERVFICPGSTEAAFLEATLPAPDLELVLTTHESVAVAAADGHARATGRPAVAYVHTHLGLENGLAHLACAHLERSPVVVLNGLKSTRLQGRAGFTTSHDVRALARQHVKWDWQSLRADAVVEDLTRALRTACAAPAGPTYLGLPQDLLEADAGAPSSERVAAGPEPGHRARSDPERVAAAAAALASARRPAIVSGADLETDAAVTQLGRIAERLAAPVFAEDRRSIAAAPFPVDHPATRARWGSSRRRWPTRTSSFWPARAHLSSSTRACRRACPRASRSSTSTRARRRS